MSPTDEQNHREVVSLRQYFERELANLDRRLTEQREIHERAEVKAEAALDKRLAGMNEIREAMKDQARLMATSEQFDTLRDRVVNLERPWTFNAMVSFVISAGISILTVLIWRWME